VEHVKREAIPPELPARARGAPWVPGRPKPLYSAQRIASARNPKIAKLMRDANDELERADVAAVNAKEAARLKLNAAMRQRRRELSTAVSDISGAASVAGSIAETLHSRAMSESQKSDRELMRPPNQPVKRGRGRSYLPVRAVTSIAGTQSTDSSRKLDSDISGTASVAGSIAETLHSRAMSESQRSDRELMPPPNLPIKRGRGRSYLPVRAGSYIASTQSTETSSKSGSVISRAGLGESSAAGGRGRPPKKKVFIAPASSSDPPGGLSNHAEVTPVKRGRGRPKGSKNKPKNTPAAESQSPVGFKSETEPAAEEALSANAAALGTPGIATPGRRGRGRPRGSKNKPKLGSQGPSRPDISGSGAAM
jgi:hypothetical protein